MKDYFDHPEEVPTEVNKVLETFDENKDAYHELARVRTELNGIGWDFDYYLDAVPFDLQPLNK
jgi:hypothetical protein